MFAFWFEILIFGSLAVILLLMMRMLPKITDEVFIGSRSFIKVHELVLILEKIDILLKSFIEKFLRRIKIILLRFDTFLTKKITQFNNERTKEKVSFSPLIDAIQNEKKEQETVLYDFVTTISIKEEMKKDLHKEKDFKKIKKVRKKKIAL